jgi:protein-disulfide isomerase
VVVVYRHVSLSSIRSADDEAEAAECVAIQGGDAMFWKFIGAVYDFPKYPHHLDAAAIKTITRSVGVDLHLFSNCMQYHNGLPRVAEDANESAIAGIITSPTVIVRSSTRAIPVVGDNEALVRGAVDYILSTNQYQK